MNLPVRIGMDTSKSVFQLHGVDENEVEFVFDHHQPRRYQRAVPRRQPLRRQPRADARRLPDYKAPIVRNGADGRDLATARWGMPSSGQALLQATKKRADKLQAKGKTVDFKELLRMEPDGGTTNIRNVKSKHWTRWLGVENRCVVPFNSFSEFNKAEGGDIWFALDETRPLACFAGIWTNWTSVRKVKEGETTNDLYAFLTTEANAEVFAIHPKAMPVILTTPEEIESWMTAPLEEALKLQRPLPGGTLRIVARGVKEDQAAAA
ncbi:putative SOS response-associated peptidase YedK [Bradyrhizobium japonicum]|uniref:Abasic site processing protein n=1 Tax=Bradyrhizobium japonicum TaxID=375 RepID=A0ABV2RK02_BRAJP